MIMRMQQSPSAKFWSFFLLLNRFVRLSVNENLFYWAPFRISFISFSVYENFRFKSEQYLASRISAYLIYGDHQRGLFITRPFYSCVVSYLAINTSEAVDDLALLQTYLLFSCKCKLGSIRTNRFAH